MDLTLLRRLCAQYWNPIGVPMSNVSTETELGYPPLPEGEYDGYLLKLVSMSQQGAKRSELINFLDKVERDYLMLSHPDGDKSAFVDAVLKSSGRV